MYFVTFIAYDATKAARRTLVFTVKRRLYERHTVHLADNSGGSHASCRPYKRHLPEWMRQTHRSSRQYYGAIDWSAMLRGFPARRSDDLSLQTSSLCIAALNASTNLPAGKKSIFHQHEIDRNRHDISPDIQTETG